MKLNIGCGPHYAKGWTNVDVIANDECHPDVVASVLDGLPFEDGAADRIYLGHVLEHIPWARVPEFLEEIYRVASAGCELMIVGPDVNLTIKGWAAGKWHSKDGDGGYWLVESVLEHSAYYMTGGEGWEGARHQWNCTEERSADIVQHAGFELGDSYTGRLLATRDKGWPLVADSEWQFGFAATKLAG
jgi:predicted SAM-dependent methyltransferase